MAKKKEKPAEEQALPVEEKTSMVAVDDKTKQKLFDLHKKSQEINRDMQLILETYLNAKGLTGTWQISGDMAALIRTS